MKRAEPLRTTRRLEALRISLRAAAVAFVLFALPLGAQPPSTEAPGAETGAPDRSDYRIGDGDLLAVDVFGVDELDAKVRVLRDGTVSMPLLGPVAVAGMSLDEAERKIARLLAERRLVNDPHVTLFVEEFMSRAVSVQGAVVRPGSYQILGSKTLIEVLGEAGGLSGREGERPGGVIYVLRNDATGRQVRLEIDADRLRQGDPRFDIPLHPGDVVMVPYAEKQRVYVSGAVENPGAVEYLSSEGITVLQAVTAAGGPTERARLGNVLIKRRLADGGEEQVEVDLKRIQRGKDPDVPLEKNDTVVVGTWFF